MVPRRAHADWAPAPDRADPIDVLLAQARTRIPQLVPIRHGRMLRSPFAFFRGAAAIMAADLAPLPSTGLTVQLCGDAHLGNFGAFAAPDRDLVFDLNDFDETAPGPFEWDLKRLAASIAICGRDRGFASADRQAAVRSAAAAYRRAMDEFTQMRTLEVWYARLDAEALAQRWALEPAGRRRKDFDKAIAKAQRKNALRALHKLTYDADGDGVPRIISDPPLIIPFDELVPRRDVARLRARALESLDAYRATLPPDRRHALSGYRPVDLAHKVVGVGSVGTRAWIVLMLGADARDPLFLQLKEAGRSVVGGDPRVHQGRRVVEGQRLMQAAGDLFLGWTRVPRDVDGRRRDYYVRQLWDNKASVDLEAVTANELVAYADVCGWTLARAHARSGDRVAIDAYLGGSDRFDRALATFAEAYAEQNERDHAALAAAVDAGRVAADRSC